MSIFVYTGNRPSKTAALLARGLGGKRIKTKGSRYHYREGDTILNYGAGVCYIPGVKRFVNNPSCVRVASNKLEAFKVMREAGVCVPDFTTSVKEALEWESPFIGRKLLQGSGGKDAVYLPSDSDELEVDEFKLFTRYIKKAVEYRIHVMWGEVLDTQQKRKRNGVEDADFKIRNHDRGWVFCRHHVDEPHDSVYSVSIEAVRALGLDFGAVDVVYNQHYREAYVLEVNTAPGLEATTLDNYINRLKEMI